MHTPEGMALPPNVLAELQRDMARLGFVVNQIREIEDTRQKRLEQEPETGHHAMVRQMARVIGIGIETADMLVNEVLSRPQSGGALRWSDGPAARSFAADAHDCIMVRIQTDLPHTSVRREDAPNGELPSDDHADINRRHQTPKLRKGPSRGSSSLRVLRLKALRNTSDARRQAAKLR